MPRRQGSDAVRWMLGQHGNGTIYSGLLTRENRFMRMNKREYTVAKTRFHGRSHMSAQWASPWRQEAASIGIKRIRCCHAKAAA